MQRSKTIYPVTFPNNIGMRKKYKVFISFLVRSSHMSESGTTERNWRVTEHMGTQTTPVTEDIRSASSVMNVTLTMMSCLNTCAETTTSAISVMQMDPRNITG